MKRRSFLAGLAATPLLTPIFAVGCSGCSRGESSASGSTTGARASNGPPPPSPVDPDNPPPVGDRLELSEAEWRARLDDAEFYVLREKGTERPFTHPLNGEHRSGTFYCAGCGAPLFASTQKFDSGTGWPSFWQPIETGRVAEESDTAFGMVRTEVLCARCDGHLGHVFPDGPPPTGLRYCINGVSLEFVPTSD